jgi:uncharacterized protein YbdZ (MbtH family)
MYRFPHTSTVRLVTKVGQSTMWRSPEKLPSGWRSTAEIVVWPYQ